MFSSSTEKIRLPNSRLSRLRASARVVLLVAILAACAFVAYAFTSNARIQPSKFVTTNARPIKPIAVNDAWYWMETPTGPKARLVKASGNSLSQVASEDVISSFDASSKAIAWTCREGKTWLVKTAGPDGNPRILFSGPQKTMGLKVDGDMVFFLVSAPSPAGTAIAVPVLDGRLDVMAVSIGGGTPNKIATLFETEGEIFGTLNRTLYISTYRGATHGNSAIYTLSPQEGLKRVAGDGDRIAALVTRDGTLYWTGISRESSLMGVTCSIMRLKPGGKVESLSDWYPDLGRLVETPSGVLYVDGGIRPVVWPISDPRQLPQPLPNPPAFGALAVANSGVLYYSMEYSAKSVPLYRGPLP